jgi:hypothetical protein
MRRPARGNEQQAFRFEMGSEQGAVKLVIPADSVALKAVEADLAT